MICQEARPCVISDPYDSDVVQNQGHSIELLPKVAEFQVNSRNSLASEPNLGTPDPAPSTAVVPKDPR